MGDWMYSRIVLVPFLLLVFLQFDRTQANLVPKDFVKSLGLTNAPKANKMNVSQTDYAHMVSLYTNKRRRMDLQRVPRVHRRFYHIRPTRVSTENSTHKISYSDKKFPNYKVEGATLRMFLVPEEHANVLHFIIQDDHRNILQNVTLDKSELPKWVEIFLKYVDQETTFHVTCLPSCTVIHPTLNFLKFRYDDWDLSPVSRRKRNADNTNKTNQAFVLGQLGSGQTGESFAVSDCRKLPSSSNLCCRRQMQIYFKNTPGFEFVVQPFSYDVGYCQGVCSGRHNWVSPYTNIKSLFHSLKNEKNDLCCVPYKLEDVDILYVSAEDPTKLAISTWVGMIATECGCT